MKLTTPNREPDWIWDNKKEYRIYFDEMLYDWKGYQPNLYKLKFIENEIYVFYEHDDRMILEEHFQTELNNAYKEWQFNKKMKELLCES